MRPEPARRIGLLAAGVASVLLLWGPGGCAAEPGGPAVSGSYSFWPVPPAEPRVQFLRSFNSSEDVQAGRAGALSRLVFGDDSETASAIRKPYGVEMRGGRIYVCDTRGQSLVVLDLEKREMRLVGVSGLNRLSNPVDVAVADDGEIYVADNQRGSVMVFDARERFARAIGGEGFRPVGVAVHGERLYVCNLSSQVVEVFDRRSGQRVATIGEVGDEDGQFRVPLGIDTDAAGNVYVVDMMRCRLQKFSADGELIGAAGALGDVAGSFSRPKQVAVDRDGIVYVVDAAFQNVQMFDEEFRLLMSFGAAGGFPGAMNLPAGICVADDGLGYLAGLAHPGFEPRRVILVTNQFGPSKVSAYALGMRRGEWSVSQLSASATDVATGAGTNPESQRLQIPVEEEPVEQDGR